MTRSKTAYGRYLLVGYNSSMDLIASHRRVKLCGSLAVLGAACVIGGNSFLTATENRT